MRVEDIIATHQLMRKRCILKTNKVISAASLACVAASIFLAQPAQAASASSASIDYARLRAHMSSLGLSQAVEDVLITKLKHGQELDSMKGESPVAIETKNKNGYTVTVKTYADGSVDERGMEIGHAASAAELRIMESTSSPSALADHSEKSSEKGIESSLFGTGISSCTRGHNGGVSYAQGCHVYYSGISASNSFDANYQIYPGGAKAQYVEGTAQFVSFFESVSNEHVNVYDDGSRIRYSFSTSFNGFGNIPGYLQLQVSSRGAVVTGG